MRVARPVILSADQQAMLEARVRARRAPARSVERARIVLLAAAVGLSEKSVRRIWQKHGLKPHLARTFKVSNDPEFSKNWRPPSGFISSRQNTSSYSRPTRRVRFRLWTVHNPVFP